MYLHILLLYLIFNMMYIRIRYIRCTYLARVTARRYSDDIESRKTETEYHTRNGSSNREAKLE